MVSLMIPTAHLLLSWIGVGPCWCPSSSSMVQIGTASRVLMKAVPVSASCAEDIMASMILHITRMAPLSGRGM